MFLTYPWTLGFVFFLFLSAPILRGLSAGSESLPPNSQGPSRLVQGPSRWSKALSDSSETLPTGSEALSVREKDIHPSMRGVYNVDSTYVVVGQPQWHVITMYVVDNNNNNNNNDNDDDDDDDDYDDDNDNDNNDNDNNSDKAMTTTTTGRS